MSNSPLEQLEFVLNKHQKHYNAERLLEDLTALAREVNTSLVTDAKPRPISELATRAVDVWFKPGYFNGSPSGFPALDSVTGGFKPGELTVIGARPGTGKTFLMLQFCLNMAGMNVPSAWISFDLTADQVLLKMLSNVSEISTLRLRNGELRQEDQQKVRKMAEKLGKLPIFIDDSPAQNVFSIRQKCGQLVKEHGVRVVFIDYLQMIKTQGRQRTRDEEVALITRELKRTARELNISIIAASQLSRAVEQRGGNKRPQLSDLRESGAIEQDADMVLFIYRPEMAGITQDENGYSTEGLAEVIVAKNRSGMIGSAELGFVAHCGKYSDNVPREVGFINEQRIKEIEDDL